MDEAKEVAVEYLEGEAHRRAYEGTLRPVFQGGERVGAVREYSDTLMIFLLKALKPGKYRETQRHEHTGAGGTPLKHEHVVVSVTAADVEAARAVLGVAGGDVHSDG